jgi:hypothetical protein
MRNTLVGIFYHSFRTDRRIRAEAHDRYALSGYFANVPFWTRQPLNARKVNDTIRAFPFVSSEAMGLRVLCVAPREG